MSSGNGMKWQELKQRINTKCSPIWTAFCIQVIIIFILRNFPVHNQGTDKQLY